MLKKEDYMLAESHYIKRSWVEINLSQVIRNYQIYKANLIKPTDIMAIIKADAYGHGDVKIMKALSEEGVCNWAVSNIEEAIRLREAGCEGEILILGYTPIEELPRMIANNLTQTLLSRDYADAVFRSGVLVKSQFALDTGMNRIGLDTDYPEECESIIRYYASRLPINGLFTHLCVADSNKNEARIFTKNQIKKFNRIVNSVKDLKFVYNHCLNSAGGLWYESENSSFVRLGIILYGLKPDILNKLPVGIEPVLTWKSVVSMIKTVKAGESIGYGRSYIVKKDMIVATIPTGYADGYNRALSNKGYVIINGYLAKIVGKICMDQFMVDISEVPGVKIGTIVILIGKDAGKSISADELAEHIGTIGYEIVCGISKRVPRIYYD